MHSDLILFAVTLSDTAVWFSANGATLELRNKSNKPFDPGLKSLHIIKTEKTVAKLMYSLHEL